MYRCDDCGAIYGTDGKTKVTVKKGTPVAIFAIFWTCPSCLEAEKLKTNRWIP
jgi:rubredoxin